MLKHSYIFKALGTPWRIETNIKLSPALKNIIQNRIYTFDATYSRFKKDSLVTQISKKAGEYTFPEDAQKLFSLYKELYDASNGRVTPLIGEMIARAGYDSEYSLQPQAQKPIPAWEEAMQWNDLTLHTNLPITLDVGAAGKGYMVDIIASILDEHAVEDYVIDASGDLRHKGSSENKVGLEHPLDTHKVIGVVDVRNKSLCASASNRRVWGEGMHHIFDPNKMAPIQDVIATWVIADEAMVADGLATALFFVDPVILRSKFDYEYARVLANGSIEYSAFFKGALF